MPKIIDDALFKARIWLLAHPGFAGVCLATALALISYGGLEIFFLPKTGEMDQMVSGTVTGFLLNEDWYGSSREAIVQAKDGRSVAIAIPKLTNCRVGSSITFSKRRTWWGSIYVAGYGHGCAP